MPPASFTLSANNILLLILYLAGTTLGQSYRFASKISLDFECRHTFHRARDTTSGRSISLRSLPTGIPGLDHIASQQRIQNYQASQKAQWRRAKFSRVIRDELAPLIANGKIKASRYPPLQLLKATSVSSIDLNKDMSIAKVHVNTNGNASQKRQVLIWLTENVKQVRYALHSTLRSYKRLPILSFHSGDEYALPAGAAAVQQRKQHLIHHLHELDNTPPSTPSSEPKLSRGVLKENKQQGENYQKHKADTVRVEDLFEYEEGINGADDKGQNLPSEYTYDEDTEDYDDDDGRQKRD